MNSNIFQTSLLLVGVILVLVAFLGERILQTGDADLSDQSSLQLLQRVIDDNSVESLMLVLDRNGIPHQDLRLGGRQGGDQSDGCVVSRARKIKSGGEDYYVIIASQRVNQLIWQDAIFERVFVFDRDGECIYNTYSADKLARDNQIFVRTLGSLCYWFIFESVFVRGSSGEKTLPSQQTVFLVCPDMVRLIVINMQLNVFAFTASPEHVEVAGKIRIAFRPDSDLPVTDRAGNKIEPVIEWKEDMQVFCGPSEGFVGGELLFSVDMPNSSGFIGFNTK